MAQVEKYVGEAKLMAEAKKKLVLMLGNKVVTPDKIADKAITADKLADDIRDTVIAPLVNEAVEAMKRDLGHIAMIRQ